MLDLLTPEGEALLQAPEAPAWQVYPRPQMKRDSYLNLNGTWLLRNSPKGDLPPSIPEKDVHKFYPKKIQVPFCPECRLSGIQEHFPDGSYLFYFRRVTLPQGFNRGRVLLHIGAADQTLDCYVNQKHIGTHVGGYEAMTFDITDALEAENELVLRVVDDLRSTTLPYGKQVLNRGGMWYTPVSGIWQSVWLESVPSNYVNRLDIQVNGTTAVIRTEPAMDGTVLVEGLGQYPLVDGKAEITPDTPHLWSPDDPHLYRFTLRAGEDVIESYFALRTLQTQVIDGIPRLCLNGKPYFFHGLLDQGYWPDGIYTPAAPECYQRDILTMKSLGFNTLRKHIKVEPEQFYYDCDRLGMLVFQDMVNNGDYAYIRDTVLPTVGLQVRPDKGMHKDEATREAFLSGMKATVQQLKNHPSIVYWTIFNEGWGQFDSDRIYGILKELDDSRIIDSTSGWFRRKQTDVDSRHIYFGPWKLKASDKPLVLSEFGGYTCSIENHIFNPDKSYGYRTCTDRQTFQKELLELYETRILPVIPKGLCGAIYTQVSDVEDEINGLVTYDRRVTKLDPAAMQALAARLQVAMPAPIQC